MTWVRAHKVLTVLIVLAVLFLLVWLSFTVGGTGEGAAARGTFSGERLTGT